MPSPSRILARVPIATAVLFCTLFVVVPLCVVVGQTFFDDDGFTLRAWTNLVFEKFGGEQLLRSLELGVAACAVANLFGFGHAWLCERTDLPFARQLGPLAILPLVVPPILVAMGFADFWPASGFWICAMLLGTSYAPFVAVMTARGLRAVDGRSYEAALLARGRPAAERMLLRRILPEIAAGTLFAFVFVVSDHGVPEFLTVKGKTWHTYAEHVQSLWTRRATGITHEAVASPIVASLPLILLIVVALWLALRFRAHSELRSDFRPLPQRSLGRWRWPALALPITFLTCGVGVPITVMLRWAAGSSQKIEPMSVAILRRSFHRAVTQAGDDIAHTLWIGLCVTVLLLLVAIPLAQRAARRSRWIEGAAIVPLAVPAVLLSIGFIRSYNSTLANDAYAALGDLSGGNLDFDFYNSVGIVVCEYVARFLPFGVITLAGAARRRARSLDEATLLAGRGPLATGLRIHLPLLAPAAWSVACLGFILALRELDCAVLLPSGNGTIVRRLSNIVHFGGEDVGGALAILLLFAAVLFPILTLIVTGRKLRTLS
ncbi:MAG: ABC transporter permease subunit [Planctomycetota bacterium]